MTARIYWVQDQPVSSLTSVQADLAATYNTAGSITTDLGAEYLVASSAGRIYWVQDALYNVTAVTSDLTAAFSVQPSSNLRVSGVWSPAVLDRFFMLSPSAGSTILVVSSLTGSYGLGGGVSSDTVQTYQIVDGVTSDLVALYMFQGAAPTGVTNIARVPALENTAYVPALENTAYVMRG